MPRKLKRNPTAPGRLLSYEESMERARARREELRDLITSFPPPEEMDGETRQLWNAYNEEFDMLDEHLRAVDRVRELARDPRNVEHTDPSYETASWADDDWGGGPQAWRSAALRTIDRHDDLFVDPAHGDRLVRLVEADLTGRAARYIAAVGDPDYLRAFRTFLAHPLRPQLAWTDAEREAWARVQALEAESRALGLSQGVGVTVPYTLDPTLIPVSNFSVNPWRAVARVVQIIGTNEWRGVTTGAITAAYAAEGTEATDNAPTLTGTGAIACVRAQAFIPFSREIGQDFGALEEELRRLLAEAKDDLEASKFFSGSGTNEPSGLNQMTAGADVTTATAGTFAVGDLYKLEESLPPRYRPRASIVANRAIYNRVRQFDTAGGANLWISLPQGLPNQVPTPGRLGQGLLGYPTYEASTMNSSVASGNRIMLIGDFRYFVVVDRLGMQIDLIPHLFGATNRFPTGQAGLYAFWRNTSKVLAESAFRFLKVL